MTYGTRLITRFIERLFEKDTKRLDRELTHLIQENHSLGNPREGFVYRGEFYTKENITMQHLAPKKMIHPNLENAAKEHRSEAAMVNLEKQKLMQGLHVFLRDCHTPQDVRDVLPDTVLSALPSEVSRLSRTREPGWTQKHRPLQMKQFQELSEILDFYMANQFLY